jgi:hypothetical protein
MPYQASTWHWPRLAAGSAPRAGCLRRSWRGCWLRCVISMRSPVPAKSTVWSPTMSPPRTVAKPMVDGSRSPVWPSRAHGAVLQVDGQRRGQHLAHGQRGAAGRVDLVAVVRLDDLDVVAGGQRAGRHVQQLEHHVDAHAHVGRHHDGDVLGMLGDLRLLRVVKPVVPTTADAQFAAHRQMGQRAFGPREVDQHVGAGQAGTQVGADRHAGAGGRGRRRRPGPSAGLPGHRARRPARSRRAPARPRPACGPCGRRPRPPPRAAGRHGPWRSGCGWCSRWFERVAAHRTHGMRPAAGSRGTGRALRCSSVSSSTGTLTFLARG